MLWLLYGRGSLASEIEDEYRVDNISKDGNDYSAI